MLETNALDEQQKDDFRAVSNGLADQIVYENSLKDLSEFLEKFHHKKPIILIDEYDTPINAGYDCGYYDKNN